MRLSPMKGAHAALSGAAYRKFGVSRSFFARCGIPTPSTSSFPTAKLSLKLLDRIDFKLRLLMATRGGARIRRQSQAVEDGSEHQDRDEEDSQMKVAQLGRGCRVATRMGHQAQGDGSDGHP